MPIPKIDPALAGESVSVAMCTFNGARFLPQQLESILRQTSLPDELVVCDDGSDDDTLAVLSAFADKAPFPVHVHRNAERLRFSGNFAKCIGLCGGEIIVLTDQDDEWMADRVEQTRSAFAGDARLTFTFSDAPLIDEFSKPLGRSIFSGLTYPKEDRRRLETGDSMFAFLVRWAGLLGCTLAFRAKYRKFFLPLPEAWPHDTWLTIVLSSLGPSLRQPPVTNYRQHAAQVIGAEDGSLKARVAQAQKRGLAQSQEEIAHTEQALAAATLHPELQEVLLPSMQARTRFLKERFKIKSGSIRQTPALVRLVVQGDYQRHGAGLRSAIKDMAMMLGALRG